MSDRVVCRVENVVVRPEHRETVEDLVYKLFERRHHEVVGGREREWLTVELVQALRNVSRIYREELSTKTSGPLPFALGYFKLHDGRLRLTSDTVPADVPPETLVRILSEFVEPGARLWFGRGAEQEGWAVEGYDDVSRLSTGSPSSAD